MLAHRFLATVVLAGAVTLAAGCDAVSARWSDPPPPSPTAQPTGQEGTGDQQDTADQPPPTRRNSLEVTEQTVFFLEGVLPSKQADGTTSALTGSLVLRAECHNGSLAVKVSGPTGTKKTTVSCDGRPHDRTLGNVKLGDALGVETTGKAGTDFAVALLAR
jgi:hypothetical protein